MSETLDQHTFDQSFDNDSAIDVAAQPDTHMQAPIEQPTVINGAALGERVEALQYESMPDGYIDQKIAKAQAKIEQLETELVAVQERITPVKERYVECGDVMNVNHQLMNRMNALTDVKQFSVSELSSKRKLREEYDQAFEGQQEAETKLYELRYIEEQLRTKLDRATQYEGQLLELQLRIRQALGKLVASAVELEELPEAEDMPSWLTDPVKLPNIVADEADISAYVNPISSDGRDVQLTESQPVILPAVPEVQIPQPNWQQAIAGLHAPLPNYGKKPKAAKKVKQYQT